MTTNAGKFLIVVGRFNELITKSLHDGALDVLQAHHIAESSIKTIWVPGCFEIPVVAASAARSKKFDAVICLGVVIKGETPHFDFVAGQAASGLMSISIETEVPIVFGILTTNTVEQAMNRAGIKHGNKGRDAAATALEMVHVMKSLKSGRK